MSQEERSCAKPAGQDQGDAQAPFAADPRLRASLNRIYYLLTTEELELIQLRDSAYGGDWDQLANAIRNNPDMSGEAQAADLHRVTFLRRYEETNRTRLSYCPPSAGDGDYVT